MPERIRDRLVKMADAEISALDQDIRRAVISHLTMPAAASVD
jgi:hypothetical protein